MCAILDADVAGEVFTPNGSEAGAKFLKWAIEGRGRLIIGGKLFEELKRTRAREWIPEAIRNGIMVKINARDIEMKERKLQKRGGCKSNDLHIIALAQVSGARLLYSNDANLQEDFKRKELIRNPRGKVYTTLREKNFGNTHKNLLKQKNLCRPRR